MDKYLRKYLGIIARKPSWFVPEIAEDLSLLRGSNGLLDEMYQRILVLERVVERLEAKGGVDE